MPWRWSVRLVQTGVRRWVALFAACAAGLAPAAAAERVRLATYNVENYVLTATESRPAKSEGSKAKVAEVIRGLEADVLALQEVGGAEALEDLRGRARQLGLDYPHFERVTGADTNIQVALLSRFPIVARRPHVRDAFLLSGRRHRVSRGFIEVDVQVAPRYTLTVFVAHLKSRRPSAEADEAELRAAEAGVLREKIEARLREDPRANVAVMGDLNDTKDSEAIRAILGRGRGALVDTRPAERSGDTGYTPNPRWQPRTIVWTHYYGVEDTYSRVDYILLHPNAAREWVAKESWIPSIPDWGVASDHRAIVVTLEATER